MFSVPTLRPNSFNGRLFEYSGLFDGGVTRLMRTNGTSSQVNKWSFSCYLKPNVVGVAIPLLDGYVNSTNYTTFEIGTGGQLYLFTNAGGTLYGYTFTPHIKDIAAHYHLLLLYDATQAVEANRVKLYINGTLVTKTTTWGAIPLNAGVHINGSGTSQRIAYRQNVPSVANAYITDVHFADGVTWDISGFGIFNSKNQNIWEPTRPKALVYGANGYHIPDPSTGIDTSGNGNNYTITGVITQSTDTPSNNHAVFNRLLPSITGTFTNGNKTFQSSATVNLVWSTIGFDVEDSRGYTFEVKLESSTECYIGICDGTMKPTDAAATTLGVHALGTSGGFRSDGLAAGTFTSYAAGDVLTIYCKSGDMFINKNGVAMNGGAAVVSGLTGRMFAYAGRNSTSFSPVVTLRATFSEMTEVIPTGYKAISTSILPEARYRASDYNKAVLYTGNGSAQAITGVGFQPDFVWIKDRYAENSHVITDSVRGISSQLLTNSTSAPLTSSKRLTSFDIDGFSVGNESPNGAVNDFGNSYVAWCLKQGPHFQIVSYTGNGLAGHTVPIRDVDGLGIPWEFVIVKNLHIATNWLVQHKDKASGFYGYLNLANAYAYDVTGFTTTNATHDTLTLGTAFETNKAGSSMIAYCFRSVPGLCDVFSYTGNASIDGPFINHGGSPLIALFKANTNVNWYMLDKARDPYNEQKKLLYANTTTAEATQAYGSNALSNGTKITQPTGYGYNYSGVDVYGLALLEGLTGAIGAPPMNAK